MADLIDRQATVDRLKKERSFFTSSEQIGIGLDIARMIIEKRVPSAQPEYNLDEWCTDCKEYDHERHCCPRFNHVIRTTLQEIQTEQPEIVRCKDCMHWCNHKRLNIPWCRELHIDRGAEDFCSMAKRRE